MLAKVLDSVLWSRGSHVDTATILDNLDWQLAGQQPAGSPYSIWQLANHLIFWQDFSLALLRGESPQMPEHAEGSWPGGPAPAGEREWAQAVARFKAGLAEARRQAEADLESDTAARPGRSKAETLASLADHDSYHAGQVVMLRRMLGSWPPPTGGDTW